jgi:5-methylcytosine-specific restriction endonuclease McrA
MIESHPHDRGANWHRTSASNGPVELMASRRGARLAGLTSRVAVLDTRTARPPVKKAAPFYLSPEWRALMDRLIAERGRRCEECGCTGCRIYGDHVVELQDGGAALDETNIKLLCGSCHTRKTAAERARRQAAPLPTGQGVGGSKV